jgi:hypothetical protein
MKLKEETIIYFILISFLVVSIVLYKVFPNSITLCLMLLVLITLIIYIVFKYFKF